MYLFFCSVTYLFSIDCVDISLLQADRNLLANQVQELRALNQKLTIENKEVDFHSIFISKLIEKNVIILVEQTNSRFRGIDFIFYELLSLNLKNVDDNANNEQHH